MGNGFSAFSSDHDQASITAATQLQNVDAKTDPFQLDDEVEVTTEKKVDGVLKCVVMTLNTKEEHNLNHSSYYSIIKFCKKLMSKVKDEHTMCQIKNERDINDLSNPIENVDALSRRLEYAINDNVETVYFIIAPIEKVSPYTILSGTVKIFTT